MVWGKRDDQAWRNEHLIGLTHEEYRLYDVALSFCAMEWPDGGGRLSQLRAVSLARMHGIDDPEAVVDGLHAKGRWEPCDVGHEIHDFGQYMLDEDEIDTRRLQRSEAGRIGGLRSAAARTLKYGSAQPSASGDASGMASAVASEANRIQTPKQTPKRAEASPKPVTRNPLLTHPVVPPTNGSKHNADVAAVFAAWVESTGKTTAKLTDSRRVKISARLREYPLADVLDAVRGWRDDPWAGRAEQNDLTILLRSAEQCEKFRDLHRRNPTRRITTTEELLRHD